MAVEKAVVPPLLAETVVDMPPLVWSQALKVIAAARVPL